MRLFSGKHDDIDARKSRAARGEAVGLGRHVFAVLLLYYVCMRPAEQVAETKPPRVFISYAWEDDAYKGKVRALAERLQRDGVCARLDELHHQPGQTIPQFIQYEIEQADKILIVCSPHYRRKVSETDAGSQMAGVGYEAMILTSTLWSDVSFRRRIVALLLRGEWRDAAPPFVLGLPFIDLRNDSEAEYSKLILTLHGLRVPAQPSKTEDISALVETESKKRVAVSRPSAFRRVLDRHAPRLHQLLTSIGVLARPNEYEYLIKYLSRYSRELEHDIRRKLYVRLRAKVVPDPTFARSLSKDPFILPIHQLIRVVSGQATGGDSASAQIAAANRKSKVVRNLLNTLAHSSQPIVLLGDPGCGKTLTLKLTCLALAQAEKRKVFPSIPLYVRLGEFHVKGTPTPEDVIALVRQAAPAEIVRAIEELSNAGRLTLVFDGMDEMSRLRYNEHTEALSEFAAAQSGRVKTLFSCRITDFSPAFQHQRVVLLPFDRPRVREYLERYFGTEKVTIEDRLWTTQAIARRILSPQFPVDARNPYVLSLLCEHLVEEGGWPKSRINLIEAAVRKTYQAKLKSGDIAPGVPRFESLLREWARIAFALSTLDTGNSIPFSQIIKPSISARDLNRTIRIGKRCGVLAESSEDFAHLVCFEHHRMQEYFTALQINLNGPDLNWSKLIDAPRWQETLINLCLMGETGGALQTLKKLLEADVVKVAAWAAAKGKLTRSARRVLERLSNPDVPAQTDDEHLSEEESELVKSKAPLTPSQESLLADRIELAATISKIVSRATSAEDLASLVSNAITVLMPEGTPPTQVKLLRAGLDSTDPAILDALRIPLSSKTKWVRDKALIVLSSADALASGEFLFERIGYDLATGEFFGRVPAYVSAARESSNKTATRALRLGLCFAAINLTCYLLAGIACYFAQFYFYPHIRTLHIGSLPLYPCIVATQILLAVLVPVYCIRGSPDLLCLSFAAAISVPASLLMLVRAVSIPGRLASIYDVEDLVALPLFAYVACGAAMLCVHLASAAAYAFAVHSRRQRAAKAFAYAEPVFFGPLGFPTLSAVLMIVVGAFVFAAEYVERFGVSRSASLSFAVLAFGLIALIVFRRLVVHWIFELPKVISLRRLGIAAAISGGIILVFKVMTYVEAGVSWSINELSRRLGVAIAYSSAVLFSDNLVHFALHRHKHRFSGKPEAACAS